MDLQNEQEHEGASFEAYFRDPASAADSPLAWAVSQRSAVLDALRGLFALLGGAFVTSNRESGDGRYDIQLKPTQKGLPGILIELKAEKNCSDEKLKKLSETALQQINDKKYETELTTAGVRTIYKYGVAFSGKKVEVAVG
jgi:hypothetical protein